MPRSISARLILAFLVVSITGVALAAGISYWLTEREFLQLVYDQARSRFVTEAEQHYQTRGTWEGVEAILRNRPEGRDGRGEPRDPAPTGTPPAAARPNPRGYVSYFALTDRNGRVLIAATDIPSDTVLSAAQLAGGEAIELNGERVGTVVSAGRPPLGPLEQSYLDRTNRALLYAAAGSAGLAILLGVVLARTLTQPVRAMTTAIQAMAAGDLKQTVKVSSSDELGDLARAFNTLSAELDRLIQSRRQLTADIAHDLRTPLTVIGGYVESMRDGVLRPTPERLATVNGEVQLLRRLVDDLGTLAQAEGGDLRLNRAPLAPDALLRTIALTYQALAADKGITLTVDASADLPMFSADPDRLAQVFGNLVTNALRHTPRGGTVTFRARHQEDGHLALSVTDSGEGIDPAELSRIFDRFYRGDRARAAHGESGLGLAIAKSIVEAHGGTITAESVLGRGTTMRIRLPVQP